MKVNAESAPGDGDGRKDEAPVAQAESDTASSGEVKLNKGKKLKSGGQVQQTLEEVLKVCLKLELNVQ